MLDSFPGYFSHERSLSYEVFFLLSFEASALKLDKRKKKKEKIKLKKKRVSSLRGYERVPPLVRFAGTLKFLYYYY